MDQSVRNHLKKWRTIMSKRTRLRIHLSLLIRVRLLPEGTSFLRHLSGDPLVLWVLGERTATGTQRTMQHSRMLTHLQPYRIPENTKCILKCSLHLLGSLEVTIQTILSSEMQVWLWPKECCIHQIWPSAEASAFMIKYLTLVPDQKMNLENVLY